jgi:hypothetical protein
MVINAPVERRLQRYPGEVVALAGAFRESALVSTEESTIIANKQRHFESAIATAVDGAQQHRCSLRKKLAPSFHKVIQS